MSYTELQSGKITVIGKFTEEELDDHMRGIVQKELPDTYELMVKEGFPCWIDGGWLEVFNSYVNNKEFYIYKKGTLFKVSEVKNFDEGSYFCNMTKASDNEYKFLTQYYNGGTCLEEILAEKVEQITSEL